MAIFDTIPLQVTIGTMPSVGSPFKVVYQNQLSSAYFGPLECNTPMGLTLSEAFIWEQLLGTSDSKRREELVTEMLQVAQTGNEWRQAVPMDTLVTIRPVERGECSTSEEEAVQVNSGHLRLLSIMTPNDDYKPHSSGIGSVRDTSDKDYRSMRASSTVDDFESSADIILTESPKSPAEGNMKEEDVKVPYSMLQLIRVTAKTWRDAASGQ
eukprot:gene21201-28108_t